MGVNYRTIDLPFGGGVDSKTNAQLANVPKMSQVVNMRFFESGAYSRRESYTAIAQPSGTLNRLTEYGGAPLALTSTGLFRYIEGQWRSATTPGPRPVGVRRRPIVRSDEGADDVFSAAAGGLVASVWTRGRSLDDQVWFQVADATGALIYGPVVVNNALGDTHADDTGLDVFPLYSSSGDLYFVVLCRGTATTYPTTTAYRVSSGAIVSATQANLTSPASMVADGSLVEVLDGDTSAYLLAYNGSVNALCRLQISGTSCVVESSATITSLGGAGFAKGILVNDVAAKVFVYGGDVSELKTANFTYGAALTGTTAATSLYVPGASPAPKAPILAVYGATRADGTMVLFCETEAVASGSDPDSAPCVKWFELSSAGALVASAERTIWSTQLLARPFLYDSRIFCPIVGASVTIADAGVTQVGSDVHATNDKWVQNPTAYLLEVASASDADGRRAAEFLVDVSRRPGFRVAPGPDLGRVSRTSLLETGGTQYAFAAPTDTIETGVALSVLGGAAQPQHTGDVVTLNMAPKPAGVAHANGAQLFAGGYVSQVDGERHAEVMQCPRPTIVRAESQPDGNSISGTVAWCFVWVWRDRLGNVHRSAPSDTLLVDLDDAAFSTQGKGRSPWFRIAIPPFLDATAGDGDRPTDVTLECYNSPGWPASATTIAFDDVFTRTVPILLNNSLVVIPYGAIRGPQLSEIRDPLRPWMTYPIKVGYSESDNLPLYTNGGVLPHDPIPHAEHIVSSRDRVWLIDSEDRYRALHSAPIRAGGAPAFSQEFFVRVPTEAGELVALGVIGDSLCLLSETSIHMLETIEGPDSTNAGAFPPLREVSREVGCINRASVVSTDVGLFFESASGIHLLDTAGGLTHIGRDIQPTLVGQTIVGADVLPDERQVRFTASGGSVFVFDYEAAQWSTYSLASSTVDNLVSSARVNGEHVVGDASAIVYIGDGANDLSEQVLHGITTHWVKLAGLQGFKRIRKIGILGRIEFPDVYTPDAFDRLGSIVMTVAYNYDDSDVDTYTFNIAELQVANQIDPLHLRVHIARQKCAAIKIGVAYVPSPPPGQEVLGDDIFCSLTVSGLALEVGIKPGIRKIGHAGGVSVT